MNTVLTSNLPGKPTPVYKNLHDLISTNVSPPLPPGAIFLRAQLGAISSQRTSFHFSPHGSMLWETPVRELTPTGARLDEADAPTALSFSPPF